MFAFLDVLLRRPPVIVKGDDPFSGTAQVGDDEADAGAQFTGMPLDLGDDPALPVPRACLIAETGMEAPNVVGRAAEGTSEQMGDTFLKNRVGLKTDRVLVALGFQELVEVRQGKGGTPPKVAAQVPFTVSLNDGFQNVPPSVRVVDVARAQRTSLQVAKLVEQEKRVIAGAAEMAVVGRALLFAMGRADT